MRVTREELQQMIDESVSDALMRSKTRPLLESVGHDPLREADANELLEFARVYSSLSPEGRRCLHEVLVGRRDVDVEVLNELESRVGGINRQLDEAMASVYPSND